MASNSQQDLQSSSCSSLEQSQSDQENEKTGFLQLRQNKYYRPRQQPDSTAEGSCLPPLGLPKIVKKPGPTFNKSQHHENISHKSAQHKIYKQPTFSELHALLSKASNISPNTWPIVNDRRLPSDIVRRNGIQPSFKKKPMSRETTLSPLAPSSLSSRQQPVKQQTRRPSGSRRTPTIDEENDMWSKIALIENNIDQMEDSWKAQDQTRKNSHKYHLPVLSVIDDLATVPKPWPINLIVVHNKRPGSGRSDASSVHDVSTKAAQHLMTTNPMGECKFGWRIRNISRRVAETEATKAPLYSSTFSTGHNGYNMCLEVYLSGDGQDTHVSLYLLMLESDHDRTLVWPFIKPVTFQLMNQVDPTKSTSVSFVSQLWSPLHTSTKWKDGLPRFFRRHLVLSCNEFNMDDKIIIKCKISMNYSGKFIAAM